MRAYFGDFTSSGTLAIIDILARANVPQITYTNAIKITRSGYKHVINLKPNSDHLTSAALDYAVKDKGYKKLAVMALDDEYGKGNVDAIERYLKKFGGAEVVGQGVVPDRCQGVPAAPDQAGRPQARRASS